MIIDASLGRASGCCGFPPCGGQQPFPPFPPSPPVPPVPPATPSEPDAIQVQQAVTQTGIANGAVIPLAGTVRQFGDGLRYDSANHAVTVNESDVYAFDWQVNVQSAEAEGDAVIALQSLDGQTVLALSGAPAVPTTGGTVVSGSAAAFLPAGTAWALVNTSGAALNIPAAGTAPAAFAASLTVTEIGSMRRMRRGGSQNGMPF